MKKVLTVLITAALAVGLSTPAHSADVTLSGSGATSVKNLLDVCIPDYQKASGNTVNYAGGGSGAGRTAFQTGTVNFAFSDGIYGTADKKPSDFVYIPAVSFPVAVFAKLDGYTGSLNLSPSTIAGIYSGKITKWNDAAILADNTTTSVNKKTKKAVKTVAKLPALDITVWYRSDKSGTSGLFTNFLSKTSPAIWTKPSSETFTAGFPGAAIPAGTFQGGSGSDGVANGVASKNGSIGYAETSYASERKLTIAKVKNNAGEFVAPTAAATALFVNGFKAGPRGTVSVNPLSTTKGAYTLAGYSYALAYGAGADKHPAIQAAVSDFITYVLTTCATNHAVEKGYAPVTGDLADLAKAAIAEIK